MQARLRISNGYFQLWHAYVQQRQLDYRDLGFNATQCAKIADILSQPIDQLSTYQDFEWIVQQTQSSLKVPDLTLAMARCVRPEHFALLGYMASSSENIAQALDYVVRFHRLVVDDGSTQTLLLLRQHDHIRLIYDAEDRVGMENVLLFELSFAAMLYLAQQWVQQDLRDQNAVGKVSDDLAILSLLQIRFAHAAQMPIADYQQFFRCPVLFNQSHYEITFSNQVLQHVPAQADPNLMKILIKTAEEAMLQRPMQAPWVEQLHLIVAQYLALRQQAPKIGEIAPVLFMSVRTMQRHLTAQNTSFHAILEQQRMIICESMLQRQASLSDIAMALGYSDQSALARAYKAATGMTLLHRKKLLLQQQAD